MQKLENLYQTCHCHGCSTDMLYKSNVVSALLTTVFLWQIIAQDSRFSVIFDEKINELMKKIVNEWMASHMPLVALFLSDCIFGNFRSSKRVYIIAQHPIVCHVPFSPSYDNLVIIWHVRTGKSFINLNGEHSYMTNNVS